MAAPEDVRYSHWLRRTIVLVIGAAAAALGALLVAAATAAAEPVELPGIGTIDLPGDFPAPAQQTPRFEVAPGTADILVTEFPQGSTPASDAVLSAEQFGAPLVAQPLPLLVRDDDTAATDSLARAVDSALAQRHTLAAVIPPAADVVAPLLANAVDTDATGTLARTVDSAPAQRHTPAAVIAPAADVVAPLLANAVDTADSAPAQRHTLAAVIPPAAEVVAPLLANVVEAVRDIPGPWLLEPLSRLPFAFAPEPAATPEPASVGLADSTEVLSRSGFGPAAAAALDASSPRDAAPRIVATTPAREDIRTIGATPFGDAMPVLDFSVEELVRLAIESGFPPNVLGVDVASLFPSGPAASAATAKSSGEIAVEAARAKLGSDYDFGSNGPDSFDCSGLVQWSYGQAGVDMPRTSYGQLAAGTPVSRDDLRPGDVISYYGGDHSALYAGDGKVIHASTYGVGVTESELGSMPFAGARRF